ncbi:MAG: HEPN domain-containing protein [Candidatus Geothermarchaeales archaeon]
MGSSKEYVRRCLELADEFLEDARLCLTHSRRRSAINNAYYAMFHASQAILASRGIRPPKTHKGLRELLGKEVIKAGLMDKEFGRDLSNAFEMRQASSYDIYANFGGERVREIVDKAESFIKKIKNILRIVPPS